MRHEEEKKKIFKYTHGYIRARGNDNGIKFSFIISCLLSKSQYNLTPI